MIYASPLVDRVAKKYFLSLLKLLQLRFGRKKHVYYDKFSMATNCVNLKFSLNALFFSLPTGVTGYFHAISQYIHDLHD